jgi:hypothetical protein
MKQIEVHDNMEGMIHRWILTWSALAGVNIQWIKYTKTQKERSTKFATAEVS